MELALSLSKGDPSWTQTPQLKTSRIAEAFGKVFGCPAGVREDPIDFSGEGAVKDAGVVGADGEVDVGFEEGVDGVMRRIRDAADPEVGGGAGFDDGAKLGEVV